LILREMSLPIPSKKMTKNCVFLCVKKKGLKTRQGKREALVGEKFASRTKKPGTISSSQEMGEEEKRSA